VLDIPMPEVRLQRPRVMAGVGQGEAASVPQRATLSFGIVLSCGWAPYSLAASAPAHIQNLQGCFQVSYRFVEDGRHDLDIKDALEWITLKQQSEAYLIQHYGLIRTGEVVQHCNTSLKLGRRRAFNCSRAAAGS
jgi:hypothetical protein